MSFFVRYCRCGLLFTLIVTSIVAYHFDADNIILYNDPAGSGSRGSYFGYTVTLWNSENSNLNESWIFIGAPRANSSAYRGVDEPGTVFKCNIGEQCEEWVMDASTIEKRKKGSWLGGSMDIANKSNPEIVVCGSKWTRRPRKSNAIYVPGICYIAEVDKVLNSEKSDEFSLKPLYKCGSNLKKPRNYCNLGQSGFSVHVVPDSNSLEFMLGCPGVFESRGEPIRYSGTTISDPYPTKDGNAAYDYYGYAVTSGKYFEDGVLTYATGGPRAESLCGQVLVFEDFREEGLDLDSEPLELRGKQMGEYFGAALASCDIDGDERDDLLVGAPQWSEILDEGRVYTFREYSPEGSYQFMTESQIDGKTPRGRFGSAITCLGDIDYDGYADVAVGAPYDGNGAVYIFHGSENGLTRDPQKIAGPEATRGFGISISKPRDVDNNGYADIAVGAYLSGHVTLIRSKRVVSMTVTMSSDLIGGRLDREAESFTVNVCSTYGGPYAPPELNVTKELKIDEMYERATVEIDGKTWTIYKFNETLKLDAPEICRNFTIKVNKTTNIDYFEPLKLSVSQRLNINDKNSVLLINPNNVTGYDRFNTSEAVTKQGDSARVEHPLVTPFRIDCNNDICRSNLSIGMTTNLEKGTRYVIGFTLPYLRLDVKVHNFGDNAYSAEAYINIPSLIKVTKKPSTCDKNPKNTTHIQIMCQIGNPLTQNETKTFSIDLEMDGLLSDPKSIKFEAEARTSSENIGSGGNKTDLLINSVIEADIGIAGKTNEDWYSFLRRQEQEQLPDIMFKHIYEIRNHGATPLSEVLLRISIPTHWIHGDNEIEIVKLRETLDDLDGKKFNCQSADEASDIYSLSYDATTMPRSLLSENSSRLAAHLEKKFTIIDGKVFSASPHNRTLYINTTNPLVKWKTIDCIIRPFKTASKVVLIFDLLLNNLTPKIMQGKNIIFFATNGSTKITGPLDFIPSDPNQPDVIMIGTTFTELIKEAQLAKWVIPGSVFVGVLLLTLLVFALFKVGFFKRSKKLELERSMKENDMDPKVTLETASSTEALDLT